MPITFYLFFLQATFGSFTKETTPPPKESSPPPTLPVSVPLTSTSSPVSLQSFDSDLATNFTIGSTVLTPEVAPVVSPRSLHGLTSIQEYNLQQLASLAEKEGVVATTAAHPSPSSNPSPTPSFTFADLFTGDISSANNAIKNLEALAKLGSVSLNNQGKNSHCYFDLYTHVYFSKF